MFNYDRAFSSNIHSLKVEGRYRTFAELQRDSENFPHARLYYDGQQKDVIIWCSNDYLGQGCNPVVRDAICESVQLNGAGAGGTRNISGNNHAHKMLEQELAEFHEKEAALLFTSGYISNEAALSAIGKILPDCVIFSDEKNHASMIEGIRHSHATKRIFRHNDMRHLRQLLSQYPIDHPKLIAFESVYSMDGDFGNLAEIVKLAKEFGALTYLDEVHGVGMYGENGAGVAEKLNLARDIDIIQGTLAKGIGCMGGYVCANNLIIDVIRSNAPGFIFTTSLAPSIAEGARASINYLKSFAGKQLRIRHQKAAKLMLNQLKARQIPVLDSPSHIVPVMIKEAKNCQLVSQMLLDEFGFYVQPINYPTVAKGGERLRVTPTPFHSDEMITDFINALDYVWDKLSLPRQDIVPFDEITAFEEAI